MKHGKVFWGMEIIILNKAVRKALSFLSQSHSEKCKITLRFIFPSKSRHKYSMAYLAFPPVFLAHISNLKYPNLYRIKTKICTTLPLKLLDLQSSLSMATPDFQLVRTINNR